MFVSKSARDYFQFYFISQQRQPFTDVLQNGALKTFTKMTGKQMSWSLLINKVAGLRPVTFFLKETPTQVFFCE